MELDEVEDLAARSAIKASARSAIGVLRNPVVEEMHILGACPEGVQTCIER
jgi:hypothetical protein